MVLSKKINREGYAHSTSAQFGEFNILYEKNHSSHMIYWTNKAVDMIKDRLTLDAFNLFTTKPF